MKPLRVEDLDLTVRAHNCLQTAGIILVSELVQKTPEELLGIRNMGKSSIATIEATLGKMGLYLGMQEIEIAEWHSTISGLESNSTSPFSDLLSTRVASEPDDVPPDDNVSVSSENPIDPRHEFTVKEAGVVRITNLPVSKLDLDVRAYNCLTKAGIMLVGNLVKKTPAELRVLRGMGKKSISIIKRALRDEGLHLGMRHVEIVEPPRPNNVTAVRELHDFIESIEFVKEHGIDHLVTLLGQTPDELRERAGLDRNSIKIVENGLQKWGLRLGSSPQMVWCRNAKTFKDELLHAIQHLLADVRASSRLCFIAYHGVNGDRKLTLEKIGKDGDTHGFDRAVTRERVRQILMEADRKLRANRERALFTQWDPAVDIVKSNLPESIESFLSRFGYESTPEPENSYKTLLYCAEIFGLEFPFRMERVNGVGSLVIDRTHDTFFSKLSRLPETARGYYTELADAARHLECSVDLLRKVIDISTQWEFLDDACQFFWKRPSLPPRNYSVTGNTILTCLCKIFSVTNRAKVSDLVKSVARDRLLRQGRPIPDIPTTVLEGIADRSGLFTVQEGEIRRKADLEWCSVNRRDVMLLNICVERGRIVPSNLIYPSLVHAGLSKENAGVTVAYSPFLVHTQAGLGHREGIYKFVPRPEDIDLEVLKSRIDYNRNKADPRNTRVRSDSTVSTVCLEIPISPRTRLSGTYYAPEPLGLDGEWEIQASNGTDIGRITISGQVVVGLRSVISTLGLSRNELLILRPVEDTRTLIAHQ